MPLYEYICEQDGTVVELLRPMAESDAPVPDPENKGRTFRRAQSAFAAPSGKPGAGKTAGATLPMSGGCCPCGRSGGSCGSR